MQFQTFEPPAQAAEMVLYIAKRLEQDPNFGRVKLCKVMFAADFRAYGALGKSISGAQYKRFEMGPVPHIQTLGAAIQQLRASDRIVVEDRDRGGYTQHRIAPVDGAVVDESILSASQRRIIDDVLAECGPMTTRQIIDWSHEFLPWLLTPDGEEIPYAAAFAMKHVPVSERVFRWADAMIADIERSGPPHARARERVRATGVAA